MANITLYLSIRIHALIEDEMCMFLVLQNCTSVGTNYYDLVKRCAKLFTAVPSCAVLGSLSTALNGRVSAVLIAI